MTDAHAHGHRRSAVREREGTSVPILCAGEGRCLRDCSAGGPGSINHECDFTIGVASARFLSIWQKRAVTRTAFGKKTTRRNSVRGRANGAQNRAWRSTRRACSRCIPPTEETVGNKGGRQRDRDVNAVEPKRWRKNCRPRHQFCMGAGGGIEDSISTMRIAARHHEHRSTGPDAVHEETVAKMELAKIRDQSQKEAGSSFRHPASRGGI